MRILRILPSGLRRARQVAVAVAISAGVANRTDPSFATNDRRRSAAAHRSFRKLGRQRERDRPRPGPDVQYGGARSAVEHQKASIDEHLGLRPRDDHTRIDVDIQAAKPPPAEDVGHRLARGPARDELPAGRELVAAERPLEAGVELHPAQMERVADQELRVEPGGRAPVALEVRGREPQDLAERPHPPAAAASFCRFSSAASASEN